MRVRTFSRAQILQDFHLQCQSLAAKDYKGFKQEFEELNYVGKDLSSKAGELEANQEKNRYPYILPYDHCRVRLSLQAFQQHSDYINANFVPGGSSERDFICTQGPLPSTMADFWRMVWEQNVKIIVMVTALREKDIVLCNQYWPLEVGTFCHGLIQVTTVSRKEGPDYSISTITLRQRGCPAERTITHYYYPVWPDQGIPKDRSSLCAFTEHVRQHLESIPHLGPSLVHCSAGVGRSGAFVTLLWMMQLCIRGIHPKIRAAVEDLRQHRMWMVQNMEQYIFVHRCLLYWLSGGTGPQSDVSISNAGQNKERHRSSSRHRRGSRRHPRQGPPPLNPPQSTMQQLLHPGNLLRRIIPSSMWFNSH